MASNKEPKVHLKIMHKAWFLEKPRSHSLNHASKSSNKVQCILAFQKCMAVRKQKKHILFPNFSDEINDKYVDLHELTKQSFKSY